MHSGSDRERKGEPGLRNISKDDFLTFSQSTLTLALLRGIVTEGTVYYDGIDTNKLNLEALRSNITIIPQTVSAFNDASHSGSNRLPSNSRN